jgi:cytochrome b6-f complex iron-sulfur subunit
MDRKQFITTTALASLAVCLGACKDDDEGNVVVPTNVNFTLDLNAASNASLKNTGGSIKQDGVIVIALGSGNYAAFQAACPHAGTTLDFTGTGFNCSNHGAQFNTNGKVTKGPANSDLKRFTVVVTGTNLTVTG